MFEYFETPQNSDPAQSAGTNGLRQDNDGEIRYYVNGNPVFAGLVRDERGNLYFIDSSLKAVRNCRYRIDQAYTNNLMPAGEYYFTINGVLTQNPDRNPVNPDPVNSDLLNIKKLLPTNEKDKKILMTIGIVAAVVIGGTVILSVLSAIYEALF